ncbi:response regulator [Blastopirellula marina]|uniref:Response regulatory domain-containing protein n=1 Tax=Blastopirellula marina TaxID=124 RepID=A0A2S8G0Q4_9BACT|nr:response regulator [Blastopirellula marina]PQO38013.1 hypothetical protein C5Y98_07960 [Blastopirellula marina]PTL44669.1 response regulator [Blastopirellula marina]
MVKKALVVDDSRSLRLMVSDTLSSAGFEVLQCENGQEALDCTTEHLVDFVITDVNMPVLDGISFVRELRARDRFRYTPIVVLTTESAESIKQRGRAAGATGWMVKPFNPEQLVHVVKKLVP